MMMEIEDLIDSVDLVEYIGQFTDLELRGREYWGLSPLKDEDTPSFSIDPDKQCFYDFSSGKSGGILQFIKYYYNCSMHRAIKKLEEYAGVNGIAIRHEKLAALKVCKKYKAREKSDLVKANKPKVMPERVMDKYPYDAEELQIWINEGITEEVMKEFGVRYDPITDRIVYPIRDMQGEIVNVGARTLDPDYKVKGLRKYSYLQGWNGGMEVIYGLHENLKYVKEKGYLILFEGAKSVLKAASWGIRNTGAILTSHLNPNQIHVLLSTCCLNNVAVVFALDKDINVANDNNIRKLTKFLNVFYLKDTEDLLDDKDSPVDKGLDVFKKLCRNKIRLR